MILYRALYRFFTVVYPAIIRLASLWNPKARLWLDGRKQILTRLQEDFRNQNDPTIWMHCSSLGEYEQGRPVLEKLRALHPGHKLLLTFFSPSGYTVVKGKSVADFVYYLPFGNRAVASRFISITKPRLVLWIKYDYWFYYLHELRKREIPLLLISGNFHAKHPFFRWYGNLHREMLRCFTHLFVQTDHSKSLLATIGLSEVITVSGDTRFDRVIEIAEQFESIPLIEKFCGSSKVIVAGSTWPEDEEELDHFANTNSTIKFIIAPHEIHELHLKDIEKLFDRGIRYSELLRREEATSTELDTISNQSEHLSEKVLADESRPNVLIIDNIGMLSRLYKYATITYVGGGFGEEGVHNVLEAAVFGKPVIFGPVFNKFTEAIELLEESGAYTIETALELEEIFTSLLTDKELYTEVCDAAKKYVYSKQGATKEVIQYIQEKRLLTN